MRKALNIFVVGFYFHGELMNAKNFLIKLLLKGKFSSFKDKLENKYKSIPFYFNNDFSQTQTLRINRPFANKYNAR